MLLWVITHKRNKQHNIKEWNLRSFSWIFWHSWIYWGNLTHPDLETHLSLHILLLQLFLFIKVRSRMKHNPWCCGNDWLLLQSLYTPIFPCHTLIDPKTQTGDPASHQVLTHQGPGTGVSRWAYRFTFHVNHPSLKEQCATGVQECAERKIVVSLRLRIHLFTEITSRPRCPTCMFLYFRKVYVKIY